MKMTKVEALRVAIDELRIMDATDSTLVPKAVEAIDVLEGMVAQLSKPRKTSDEAKAKAKAKRADARSKMLAEVLPVLRVVLTGADGFTAKELYDRCADQLPADFTDKKVQYILLHDLAEEVIKTEVKGKANTYRIEG